MTNIFGRTVALWWQMLRQCWLSLLAISIVVAVPCVYSLHWLDDAFGESGNWEARGYKLFYLFLLPLIDVLLYQKAFSAISGVSYNISEAISLIYMKYWRLVVTRWLMIFEIYGSLLFVLLLGAWSPYLLIIGIPALFLMLYIWLRWGMAGPSVASEISVGSGAL
jgi:hypothetical protein